MLEKMLIPTWNKRDLYWTDQKLNVLKSQFVGLCCLWSGKTKISQSGSVRMFCFFYENSTMLKWLGACSFVTVTHQCEICVSAGWEASLKFIIYLLQCSFIKAQASLPAFSCRDRMPFPLLLACANMINTNIGDATCVRRKNILICPCVLRLMLSYISL